MVSTTAPKSVVFKTFTNTDGSQTEIEADVYLPRVEAASSKADNPLHPVFWVHTGGFLQGTRKFIPPHLLRGVESHGIALIAPDFRLCPQVTIAEVLDDVHDCINFFLDADQLSSSSLGADHRRIDSTRYVLGGSSAGGWISLLLGLGLVDQAKSLRVQASSVFSIYPITTVERDLAGFFYESQRPVSWHLDQRIIDGQRLAERGNLTRCIDDQGNVRSDEKAVLISTASPPASDPVRAELYNYARQEGCFANLVLASSDDVERYSVPHQVRRRLGEESAGSAGNRVAVMMVYGTGDIKVPHSQSEHVVAALEAVGYKRGDAGVGTADLAVQVREGGDHLFDMGEKEEVPGLLPFVLQRR